MEQDRGNGGLLPNWGTKGTDRTLIPVGDLGGSHPEQAEAERRPFGGDGREGVAVGDALHPGDEGAGVAALAEIRKSTKKPRATARAVWQTHLD